MEQIIKTLIYIHAFLGGLGLVTGMISIFVKKGGFNHKRTGKIFSYSMVISSLISIFVARMPNHENLFLFLIGIFTIYLVLSGNRALTLKSKIKPKADLVDKLVSGTMLLVSLGMLIIGIIEIVQLKENCVLYLFFGCFGAFLTIKDFITFKNFNENNNAWLINHIGRMIGALIASFTAFLIIGLRIDMILVWILPTIVGTIYIKHYKSKRKLKLLNFY
jgi:uncharacterized membrane protein